MPRSMQRGRYGLSEASLAYLRSQKRGWGWRKASPTFFVFSPVDYWGGGGPGCEQTCGIRPIIVLERTLERLEEVAVLAKAGKCAFVIADG
jgi:hypothetical protein